MADSRKRKADREPTKDAGFSKRQKVLKDVVRNSKL